MMYVRYFSYASRTYPYPAAMNGLGACLKSLTVSLLSREKLISGKCMISFIIFLGDLYATCMNLEKMFKNCMRVDVEYLFIQYTELEFMK